MMFTAEALSARFRGRKRAAIHALLSSLVTVEPWPFPGHPPPGCPEFPTPDDE